MTRKEKIESLEKLVKDLEISLKIQPKTNEQFEDYDIKEKILKDTKKELRSLMFTEEEIKYQNRINIISSNEKVIHNLEISTKYQPTTEEQFKDYDYKIQLMHEYKKQIKDAKIAIDNDYVLNPLQINVEDLDPEYCLASFVYGSKVQKKAIKEMFDLRMIEEYGSNSKWQANGENYIIPNLVNENEIVNVKIPKNIAFQVLNQLISVPNSKMKIGGKEMMFKVNYNDMRIELGMDNPLVANLELFSRREDDSIEWKISFIYSCRSQVDRVYSNFENRYISELGANSEVYTKYGDYIKPALAEDSTNNSKQISYVLVPNFLLHIMAKHLINDDRVALNVGNQRFEGEYDNNAFIEALDSLINDGPKL